MGAKVNNRNKPLKEQILRLDYLQPEKWWQRPKFRLVEPLYFKGIRVHSGFVTDMGTIPRSIWIFFDPINRYGHAVVIHDFALETGLENPHKLFKSALSELGVGNFRMTAMFKAVKTWGRVSKLIKKLRCYL